MKKVSLLIGATLLMLSCATLLPTPSPSPTLTQEPSNVLPDTTDPSQPIRVKAGETFDILLSSNPSTGYHWKIVGNLQEEIVQLMKQDFIAQQPVMPGSGGVDVWTFRGVQAGETTIELGYYPPSNAEEPDQTVTFTIRVE